MRHIVPVLAAFAALSAPVHAQPQIQPEKAFAGTLHPASDWRYVARSNACTLQTEISAAGRTFDVSLVTPPARDYWWLEISDGAPKTPRWGTATLKAGNAERAASFFVEDRGGSGQVTRIKLDKELSHWALTQAELTIVAGSVQVTLPQPPNEQQLGAIANCKSEILSSWGISPALVNEASKPPLVDVKRLFRSLPYPADAFSKNEQGDVDVVLVVGETGTIQSCHIIESASPSLDAASCAALEGAHVKPAKSNKGQPIAGVVAQDVAWRLPFEVWNGR